MKIFKGIHSFNKSNKVMAAAIGFFDGMHLGHKKVIEKAKNLANKLNGESLVVTFDVHPRNLLFHNKKVDLLVSLDEKIELIKNENPDNLLILYFGTEIADMNPEYFYKHYLIDILNIKGLVVGFNFHYGKDKKGNTEILKSLGEKYSCVTKIVDPIKYNGEIVSSTKIREFLKTGKIDKANKYLNRNYLVAGKIIKGHKLGSKFDVPTINISVPHDKIILQGVFLGQVELNNKKYYCLINSGIKPTIKANHNKWSLEAHILDFHKDVYGEDVKLEFIKKIRDEKKFKDINKLFEQIKRDVELGKKIIKDIK